MNRMAVLNPDLRVSPSVTEHTICAWVGTAVPGDRLTYHRGFLAIDVAPDTHRLPECARIELVRAASRARLLAEQGAIYLVQRRHGPDDYTYLLVARPRPRTSEGALRLVLERRGQPHPAASTPKAASW